jgi:hypothetical protein
MHAVDTTANSMYGVIVIVCKQIDDSSLYNLLLDTCKVSVDIHTSTIVHSWM